MSRCAAQTALENAGGAAAWSLFTQSLRGDARFERQNVFQVCSSWSSNAAISCWQRSQTAGRTKENLKYLVSSLGNSKSMNVSR